MVEHVFNMRLHFYNLYKVQDQHLTRDTIPTTLISSTPHPICAVYEGKNFYPGDFYTLFYPTGEQWHRSIKMNRGVLVPKNASMLHLIIVLKKYEFSIYVGESNNEGLARKLSIKRKECFPFSASTERYELRIVY